MENQTKPSSTWYLLPILVGIIGGVIMYLLLKDRDKAMAKKGLIVGIIITVIIWIVSAAIGSLFWMSQTIP